MRRMSGYVATTVSIPVMAETTLRARLVCPKRATLIAWRYTKKGSRPLFSVKKYGAFAVDDLECVDAIVGFVMQESARYRFQAVQSKKYRNQ